MQIPKSFELFGQTINVVYVDDLAKNKDRYGESIFESNLIRLQTPSDNLPKALIEQTFQHELVHWLYYLLGEEKLCDNEKHIDRFSHLLHQALTTSKY